MASVLFGRTAVWGAVGTAAAAAGWVLYRQQQALQAQETGTWAKASAAIKNDPVVMFGTTWCPWCTRAENLLREVGVQECTTFNLDKLEDGDDVADHLIDMTGRTSVPNIFIGGKNVGGFTDIRAMHIAGQLVPALKNAGAKLRPPQ